MLLSKYANISNTGPLAQLVEQQTLNLQVIGSSPMRPTKKLARVAELVDALDLGSSARKGMGVRLPSLAPKKEICMARCSNKAIEVDIKPINAHLCKAIVYIPEEFVNILFKEASIAQRNKIHTYGFQKGETPLAYIEQHFKPNIIEHLKEFLFKYFVIDNLFDAIYKNKIYMVGDPRISDIAIELSQDAEFHFELSIVEPIEILKWKDFMFKAPKRKNYKDIDRQVESFLKDEHTFMKNHVTDGICISDWVCFDIYPVDSEQKPLLGQYRENLWLKIGDEEADIPFQHEFIGKEIDTTFYTKAACFQEYFSSLLETDYTFCVEIKDILHHAFVYFDYFKKHFKLKTNKELHQKLIEIFSYRNDISQRRAMVEDAFKLLLSKHPFDVPNYLILRKQQEVLDAVHSNPDYQVYKNQQNFKENIRLLATKQLKETIFIDQLMHQEDIDISHHDIKGYLNLMKRARTKEFIYFHPPSTKIRSQEFPISTTLLKQTCLREKTLNHVIYHLTRK